MQISAPKTRWQGVSRKPCCYWHFVGWDCLSLGFHISLGAPNIELHLPFGFFRVGWDAIWTQAQ